MKICLFDEEEDFYKVVYASPSETPYRVLLNNSIPIKTKDIYLNGQRLDYDILDTPISGFKLREATAFLCVLRKA